MSQQAPPVIDHRPPWVKFSCDGAWWFQLKDGPTQGPFRTEAERDAALATAVRGPEL